MKIYEKAPAKINLALDVLHKREDGYHEVEMVMTTIDLADRLEINELSHDVIIISSQTGYIPLDERNLAYQAAKLFKQKYNIKRGVQINLNKNIPVAAGLAGGSSDAAATLRGLNRLWGLNIPFHELEQLGAEIGSDVPFCVRGGTAIARGRGERLETIPSPPKCWVVVARPTISVSTAEIYNRLKVNGIVGRPSIDSMKHAIVQGDFRHVCANLGNVLEEVTVAMYPEVRQIKDCMESLGADGVLMSGSGPSVFALVRRNSKAVRIYNGLRGFCREVYAVRMLT